MAPVTTTTTSPNANAVTKVSSPPAGLLNRQCSVPDFVQRYVNLANPRLGAKVTFATDEFFAAKERMLNPDPPVFIPGKYDENGKWMDGWETRRKRTQGYDYCIVHLARPGVIHGLDIDTSHFTGNYPPAASLDGCYCPKGAPDDHIQWMEVLPSTTLKGNSHHYHEIDIPEVFTHVRLNLYPDGGVARLRVYSLPHCERELQESAERIDLIAMENGGYAVAANDQHYGKPSNLLLPGRGVDMGDGWETRRRREPGSDWCIIALAHPGQVDEIEVDTAWFKGNFPDRCSIQAAYVTGGTFDSLITQSMFWPILLPEQKLQADKQHFFKDAVSKLGPITHIRFNIIPDGGISRLRLFGHLAAVKKDMVHGA